ncbi:hypothetical protein BH10PSE12_BH10PSE12_16540 [soil metagenome]
MKFDKGKLTEAAKASAASAGKVGMQAGKVAFQAGQKVWETDSGKTIMKCGAAGAALAVVVPFVSIGMGFIAAAGAGVLFDHFKGK